MTTKSPSFAPQFFKAENVVTPAHRRGADSTGDNPLGIKTTSDSFANIYWAKPPSNIYPAGIPKPTISAFLRDLTFGPNSVISPIISCPKIIGYLTPGKIPSLMEVSPLQIPHESNFMRIWPSPGFGIGLSTNSKGPPCFEIW